MQRTQTGTNDQFLKNYSDPQKLKAVFFQKKLWKINFLHNDQGIL